MPTQKRRLNVSLTKEVDIALKKIARRDKVPQATKALELLMCALEVDEDEVWDVRARKRDTAKATFIKHADAWI